MLQPRVALEMAEIVPDENTTAPHGPPAGNLLNVVTATETTQAICYKYRALGGDDSDTRLFAQRLVQERLIYFASPATLNDPFECYPHVEWPIDARVGQRALFDRYLVAAQRNGGEQYSRTQLRAVAAEQHRRLRDDIEFRSEYFYKIFGTHLGVFSVSKTFTNTLQWSHYGDSHRGFCVGIRMAAFGGSTYEVDYVDDRPSIDGARIISDGEYINASAGSIVLTKSRDWSHEQEVRVLAASAGLKRLRADGFECVFLGLRCTQEHEEFDPNLARCRWFGRRARHPTC